MEWAISRPRFKIIRSKAGLEQRLLGLRKAALLGLICNMLTDPYLRKRIQQELDENEEEEEEEEEEDDGDDSDDSAEEDDY